MKNSPLLTIVVAVLALTLASLLTLWGIGLVTKQNILGNIFATLHPNDSTSKESVINDPRSTTDDPTTMANDPSSTIQDPVPSPSPTPTPRPTGPGRYACSAEGVCGAYDNEAEKYGCPKTYADDHCLDQCGDESKHCKI